MHVHNERNFLQAKLDCKINVLFLLNEHGGPYFLLLNTGLVVGRGKKVKFRGIFRDKFAEKMADFAGISREFSRPVSLKNDW